MDISITNKKIGNNVYNREFIILNNLEEVDRSTMIIEKDLSHARVFLSSNTTNKSLKVYEEYLSKEGIKDIFLCVPKDNEKLISNLKDNVNLGEDEENKYMIFMGEDIQKVKKY